jgi:hypothetical protein
MAGKLYGVETGMIQQQRAKTLPHGPKSGSQADSSSVSIGVLDGRGRRNLFQYHQIA